MKSKKWQKQAKFAPKTLIQVKLYPENSLYSQKQIILPINPPPLEEYVPMAGRLVGWLAGNTLTLY